MVMTFFIAGPRQDIAKMGATLQKRMETRDHMIGPKPGDQKELRILNRTLRWCKDGLVFAANLRHGRERFYFVCWSLEFRSSQQLEDVWNEHGFVEILNLAAPSSAIHLTRTTWCFYQSNQETYSGIPELANPRIL